MYPNPPVVSFQILRQVSFYHLQRYARRKS
nr:MAG TPA: hypothetical protein [Bacteriophage sp.]